MKVDGGYGKFYTRDHPHEIISPYVMTFETIRYWLKELSTNPDYGWYGGGVKGLERALGMGNGAMNHKLATAWIWPREQIRLTHRINDVLEGRIVPTKFGRKTEGVWTDPPTPPRVKHPQNKSVTIRCVLGQSILSPPPTPQRRAQQLPSFKDVFNDVAEWGGYRK